jgi:hypothetical protein
LLEVKEMKQGYIRDTKRKYDLLAPLALKYPSSSNTVESTTSLRFAEQIHTEDFKAVAVSARLHLNTA